MHCFRIRLVYERGRLSEAECLPGCKGSGQELACERQRDARVIFVMVDNSYAAYLSAMAEKTH